MKKIILLASVGLFSLTNVMAQKSITASLGMLKFSDADAMLGLQISPKFSVNEKMKVGANIGYYSTSDEVLGIKFKTAVMPITGLFEYTFSDGDFSPYAGADFGLYRFMASIAGESASEGYLGLASTLGANYNINDKMTINANFKYHYIMSEGEASTPISLNAGVSFSF